MFKFENGSFEAEKQNKEISETVAPAFDSNMSVEDAATFWDKELKPLPEITLKSL